ncbi:MAG: DUF6054 family protein [Defluviitaleaceae bacterium]|nr:DUF6054 family protein [Defluviitaleaceae bacterium]
MDNITVSLSPPEAAEIVKDYVLKSGLSAECVCDYRSEAQNGGQMILLVFEKYFMRTSSRASLSVALENLQGQTRVCSVGSGGGKGALFGFDWGAGEDFAYTAINALKRYELGPR